MELTIIIISVTVSLISATVLFITKPNFILEKSPANFQSKKYIDFPSLIALSVLAGCIVGIVLLLNTNTSSTSPETNENSFIFKKPKKKKTIAEFTSF
jgi:hypothetical protein